jgi:hypothetical protein
VSTTRPVFFQEGRRLVESPKTNQKIADEFTFVRALTVLDPRFSIGAPSGAVENTLSSGLAG